MTHPAETADRLRFRRLEEAFDRLLEGTTESRRQWMEELRRRDGELAREVEALLAADGDASGRFTGGPWAGSAEAGDAELLPGPGDRLGSYRLERPLGRGGMGRVFLARRDDGTFDGEVAVKLLDTGRRGRRRGAGAVVRFCLERRILARLDHPHVARLLDAGATDAGVPYLVMEYVSGRPVDRHCRETGASLEERLRLFLQLCAAVEHAHRKGLVHRDLKPANILVTPGEVGEAGAAPSVKLLDFGIAKPLDPESGAHDPPILDAVTTEPGERWLSRAWASPEQLRGETVDYRSDVYTLGVILRYLLTDEPPRGHEGRPASASGLDADCAAIVDRATALDPSDRYAGVDELARDLRRYRDHRPVVARGGGVLYRAGRFARRRRALVAAVALALVSAAGWAFHALEQHRRLVAERDQALEITRSFLQLFEQPLADRGMAADLRAADLLEMGFRRLEPGLHERPEAIHERLLGAYASAYRALQRPERALELADRALALGPRDPHGAWLRVVKAHALLDLGRLDQGSRVARAALDRLRESDGPPVLVAQALGAVGRSAALTERGSAAEPYFAEAASVWRDRPGHEAAYSDALLDLAWARFDAGAETDALELARQALETRRAHLGDDHSELAVPLQHLGRLETARGRPRDAEPWLRRAWQLRRDGLGDEHPLTVSTLRFLTLALEEQWIDRYPELIRLLDTQERLQRAWLGPDHADRGETLMRRANARLHLGRLDEAVPDLEEALRVLAQSRGDAAPITHLARHVGARLWLARGRLDRAEALAARVVAELPAHEPVALITLPVLARIRCDQGRVEEGLALLDRALKGWDDRERPVPWRRAVAEVERGSCLLGIGQTQKAATLLRRGLGEIEARKGPESRITRRIRELLAEAEHRSTPTVRLDQQL